MICTKCYAEYLNNVIMCGDCNIPLADACLIDMPITKMDWVTSTFNITGTTQPNEIIRISIPCDYLDKAQELSSSISGMNI